MASALRTIYWGSTDKSVYNSDLNLFRENQANDMKNISASALRKSDSNSFGVNDNRNNSLVSTLRTIDGRIVHSSDLNPFSVNQANNTKDTLASALRTIDGVKSDAKYSFTAHSCCTNMRQE